LSKTIQVLINHGKKPPGRDRGVLAKKNALGSGQAAKIKLGPIILLDRFNQTIFRQTYKTTIPYFYFLLRYSEHFGEYRRKQKNAI
jgi:hypothetical protein